MGINTTLLRTLLFQEMNSMATQKILKKFDKRTSLTYLFFFFLLLLGLMLMIVRGLRFRNSCRRIRSLPSRWRGVFAMLCRRIYYPCSHNWMIILVQYVLQSHSSLVSPITVLFNNSTTGVWPCLLYPMSSSLTKTTKIPLSNLSSRRSNESRLWYTSPLSSPSILRYLENIDEALLRFLKMYFPKETKVKQLENERAAGLDQLEATGLGPRSGNCIIS